MLRRQCICTSATLQEELAKKRGATLETSAIRRILQKNGYKWLPRAQKPVFSRSERAARCNWARSVVALSTAQLREKLALAMDGVILGIPPADPTERANHCRVGEAYMWRKAGESASPDLSGGSRYGKQIPLNRAVGLWGGGGDLWWRFCRSLIPRYKEGEHHGVDMCSKGRSSDECD